MVELIGSESKIKQARKIRNTFIDAYEKYKRFQLSREDENKTYISDGKWYHLSSRMEVAWEYIRPLIAQIDVELFWDFIRCIENKYNPKICAIHEEGNREDEDYHKIYTLCVKRQQEVDEWVSNYVKSRLEYPLAEYWIKEGFSWE